MSQGSGGGRDGDSSVGAGGSSPTAGRLCPPSPTLNFVRAGGPPSPCGTTAHSRAGGPRPMPVAGSGRGRGRARPAPVARGLAASFHADVAGARRPSGATPTHAAIAVTPGPASISNAGPGSRSRPRAAGWSTRSTGTATSGPGSGIPVPGMPWSPGRISTPCPTAGLSTGPSVSCPPSPHSMNSGAGVCGSPSRWPSSTSGTRKAPGSGSPVSGRGSPPGPSTVEQARLLTDGDGVTLPRAMEAAGYDPDTIGPDPERLARIGAFVELHVEQGRALDLSGDRVGIASAIWPHGRWRFDFRGEANHAGTTRLVDRRDPMLSYAETVLAARREAQLAGAVATFGKISVEPNGVNAIPSLVRGWLDSRAADQHALDTVVSGVEKAAREYAEAHGVDLDVVRESFTPVVEFDHALRDELARVLGGEGHRTRRPRPRYRCRTRRRDPVREHPDRHAVRAQPHGRLALPGGVRRRGRLRGRGDRTRRRTGRAGLHVTHPHQHPPRHSHPQRTYWLEHAWLGTYVEPGVALDVRGRPDRRRPHRESTPRRPAPRSCAGSPFPGSPTPTATPSTAPCAAPSRSAPAPSGPGARSCTPSPTGSPPTATTPSPVPCTPRWPSPASPPWASSTTSTTPRAAPRTPTRTRWARPSIEAAADAGIRITLLDTAYLSAGILEQAQRPGPEPPPAPLLRRHGRRLGGTLFSSQGTGSRADRCRHPLRTGRARRSVGDRGALGRGTAGAAPCAPVRADGGERRLPGRTRLHAHPAPRRPRRPRPPHHRRPQHPPHRRGHRAARRQRHRHLYVPHHRTRPRRRHRPRRRPPARGLTALVSAPTATPSSTCSKRHAPWS